MEDCRRYLCAKNNPDEIWRTNQWQLGVNEEKIVCDGDFLKISNFLLLSINKYIFLNQLNIYGAGRGGYSRVVNLENRTRPAT